MPKKAHFIGIGGVGMSAVAKLLREKGVVVTGSDEEVYPPVLDFLKRENISFKTPYAAQNIPADAELIVIGKNAKLVPETNEEVAAAYAKGIPVKSFPEVLANLSRDKDTLVVVGSTGKSTCTALLAHCLEHAGFQPSYFIGAIPVAGDNAHIGAGKHFVLEGDEYPASNTDPRSKFLFLHARHTLITPLAHDHFNAFPTPADYLRPFEELARITPGTVTLCMEGPLSKEFLASLARPVVTYGLEEGEFYAGDIAWDEKTRFTILRSRQVAEGGRAWPSSSEHRLMRPADEVVVRVETMLLGKHNVQNVVGVAALAFSLNLMSPEQFAAGVASFKGLVRRLDKKSERTSIPIYEGFGSSYEKARSAIEAMRLHFPGKRLLVVFEPYTINWRRRETLPQYDGVFKSAGAVYLLEPPLHGKAQEVTVEEIAARIKDVPAVGCKTPEAVLKSLGADLRQDDAVLLLSSGPLGGLVESIPRLAEQKFPL